MKSVNFCFATHNHQPIGNFDHVIEEAYERSYRPFLEMASRYDIRISTHFSGILLEWLLTHHPEHIALLRQLVAAGSLEIIGGGYYEPILAVISDRDKHAQLTALSKFVRETLDTTVSGLWLAERVWEQPLCGPIASAGLKYVILDDTHFKAAGLSQNDLCGYFLTEDQGHTVAAFPISQELRYTIPFRDVNETIAVLGDAASESGDNIVTFADDGEKFGVWPKTFDHVYGEGWLEEFFAKLVENRSWIKMRHFGEAMALHKPKGRIYLPDASYAEMMQWALPSVQASDNYESFVRELKPVQERWQKFGQFVRGGFWRNFFVKYPESNHLHKRVLAQGRRFETIDATSPEAHRAYNHLLAAQCNDPYWHGVFGGIYLPNLRHEVYSNLLAAEAYIDTIENAHAVSATVGDINCDGTDDVCLSNRDLTITLDCARGGCISEIAYKPRAFNITNFINRRRESYHEKLRHATSALESSGTDSIHDVVIDKEEGLADKLVYDWYRHGSFIEHVLSETATCDDLATQQFLEFGDFFNATVVPIVECDGNTATIRFERTGSVFQDGESRAVHLKKSLTLGADSGPMVFDYELSNRSDAPIEFRFATEWTFGLLSGDAHDRYYEIPGLELSDEQKQLRSCAEVADATAISLIDEWGGLRIDLTTEVAADIWRAPIETVASSESGFERVYQGSILFLVWRIALVPGESRSLPLRLCVSSI